MRNYFFLLLFIPLLLIPAFADEIYNLNPTCGDGTYYDLASNSCLIGRDLDQVTLEVGITPKLTLYDTLVYEDQIDRWQSEIGQNESNPDFPVIPPLTDEDKARSLAIIIINNDMIFHLSTLVDDFR